MILSFLLIGQSNMSGRGKPDEVEPIDNPHIKVLRNGRFHKLFQPVNFDRATAGVNLAESFADCYAREHGVDVGLIPCADGGTCLDQWRRGSLLYDHAVYQVRLAERTSTLAGILWHQGESDCREDRYPFYKEKLNAILNGFREDLGLVDVPVLVGGLGDFLSQYHSDDKVWNYAHVNAALEELALERPLTGFVSAKGLTSNPDMLHFNAASLREFGLRYYEAFCKLENKEKVFAEKPSPDDAVRSAMELL